MKQSATTVGPLLTEVWQEEGGLLLLAGFPKKFTNTLFAEFFFSLTYSQQGYQTFTEENWGNYLECLSLFDSIYI